MRGRGARGFRRVEDSEALRIQLITASLAPEVQSSIKKLLLLITRDADGQ